ncbi:MAG TPA: SDR family NAD(P)-dependent oxidoreductase [Anaerolineales bacterium]|nr:SDR family NAD(P)-dependent oxidoreductase [Anaerolineales bacterium]
MSDLLRNKVVIITGASSGFGEDAARLFAKEGCKLVLAARRLERLQALASEIQAQGGEAVAIPVDVVNRVDVDLMVKSAVDLYGRIDILFNNAGFGRLDWLENLDSARDIETQVDVNLLGVIQVTRAALPYMLKQGQGHIINMSSMAGWIAIPTYSIYASTKFGVRGFTDALRREVSPLGIHVSGIYPAFARTEFSEHSRPAAGRPSRLESLRRLTMTSHYVARRVVKLADHPRRVVILPWWYGIFIAIEYLAPSLIDIFFARIFKMRNKA